MDKEQAIEQINIGNSITHELIDYKEVKLDKENKDFYIVGENTKVHSDRFWFMKREPKFNEGWQLVETLKREGKKDEGKNNRKKK